MRAALVYLAKVALGLFIFAEIYVLLIFAHVILER